MKVAVGGRFLDHLVDDRNVGDGLVPPGVSKPELHNGLTGGPSSSYGSDPR